jgi:hypothetical protein
MHESLKCEIVKDLLPSYIDELTSEITNEEIHKHLDHCEKCAILLKDLQEPEQHTKSFTSEANYLKKVRNRTRRKIAIGILAAVILVVSIFTWRIFIMGFSTNPSSIAYSVSVDGNTVTWSGTLLGHREGYSHIRFTEEAGVVTATVFISPIKLFWHTDHFTETYTAKDAVKAVYFDDLIAYENGEISRNVAELFKTRTAYVGDISADNRVANALGIRNTVGIYTNELHTSSEPYGWTLCLNDIIPISEEKIRNEKMMADSYLMLSLIENLGYVSWEYETENGPKVLTITEEEASALIGKDIKSYSTSATELQNLMRSLGMV